MPRCGWLSPTPISSGRWPRTARCCSRRSPRPKKARAGGTWPRSARSSGLRSTRPCGAPTIRWAWRQRRIRRPRRPSTSTAGPRTATASSPATASCTGGWRREESPTSSASTRATTATSTCTRSSRRACASWAGNSLAESPRAPVDTRPPRLTTPAALIASALSWASAGRGPSLRLAEQQRRERGQVAAPHRPRVAAGCLDLREGHLPRLQPVPELPVGGGQEVLGPAGDPQQAQGRAGVRVQARKRGVGIVRNRRAERADPCEVVTRVEADVERLAAAHGQPGHRPRLAAGRHVVQLLHGRDDVLEQRLAELLLVPLAEGDVTELRAGAREDLGRTVAEGHDDQHGRGLAARDQVVEDHVSTAHLGPGARVVTEAVKQVQDGVALLALRIVPGRRVDVEVAVVADDRRVVEMMVDLSPRDRPRLPRQRRPRHVQG